MEIGLTTLLNTTEPTNICYIAINGHHQISLPHCLMRDFWKLWLWQDTTQTYKSGRVTCRKGRLYSIEPSKARQLKIHVSTTVLPTVSVINSWPSFWKSTVSRSLDLQSVGHLIQLNVFVIIIIGVIN